MSDKQRVAVSRWPVIVLVVVSVATSLAAMTLFLLAERQGARAQTQIVFAGTIRDSVGAPPPPGAALRLVVGAPAQSGPPQPYCAIGSADAAGNFQLILEPFNVACTTPGTTLSLRVNDVAASQTTTVPSAPGTYTVSFTVPVPLGGQPLPTPTPVPLVLPSQPPPTTHTTTLAAGCTQVIASLGAGATPAQLAADIANPSSLVAIWRFDNAAQRFRGYFVDPLAPADLTSLAATDAVFICVSAPTSITNP